MQALFLVSRWGLETRLAWKLPHTFSFLAINRICWLSCDSFASDMPPNSTLRFCCRCESRRVSDLYPLSQWKGLALGGPFPSFGLRKCFSCRGFISGRTDIHWQIICQWMGVVRVKVLLHMQWQLCITSKLALSGRWASLILLSQSALVWGLEIQSFAGCLSSDYVQ